MEPDLYHCPHFPAVSLFQTKYLEIASCAVSLLNIYLDTSWTQTSAAAKLAKNQWKFKQSAGRMWIKLWGRVEHQPQNSTSNILRGWKKQQIFIYFKFHFHHDGGPGRRSYFEVFFSERGKFLCAKFEVRPIPPTGFLPINATYFKNVWWAYFSLNICTVVHQLELEWLDLDQNWAKTRPILFKPFKFAT